MIKFFRKIRQTLIHENKFSKYLLYALGEILLVVIGILIALSINNWNEKEKENDLKNIYSNRLINDLRKDINTLQIIKTRTEGMQSIISDFIESLESNISIDEKISIAETYFTNGWSTLSFSEHKNTYTDLSETGNMKVFVDTEVREKILSYYSLIDKFSYSYEINKDWVLPLDVTISQETDALGFSSQTKGLYNLVDKSNAIVELKTQKKLLKRHASVHFWINNSTLTHFDTMQQTAEELILALEQ